MTPRPRLRPVAPRSQARPAGPRADAVPFLVAVVPLSPRKGGHQTAAGYIEATGRARLPPGPKGTAPRHTAGAGRRIPPSFNRYQAMMADTYSRRSACIGIGRIGTTGNGRCRRSPEAA